MAGLFDIFTGYLSRTAPVRELFVSLEFERRYADYLTRPAPLPELPVHRPLISVIAPEGARGLEEQSYPAWERVASPEEAGGAYLMYLHKGDRLLPEALLCFAAALCSGDAAPDMLYADADILRHGQRCEPHFKPDAFSTDILSYDCIGRPLLLSKALHDAVGGEQEPTDAASYALALRTAARCERPRHIARVLLSSAPPDIEIKAAREALKAYGKAPEGAYVVQGIRPNTFRSRLRERDCGRIGVILPAFNNVAALRATLESIERCALYPNYRIYIVDGGSEELALLRYYDILRSNGAAKVYREDTSQLATLWNRGARRAHCPLLLFMKPGAVVRSPDFLLSLAELALRPDAGAVSAVLADADGRPQPPPGMDAALYRNLNWMQDTIRASMLLRGDCLMVRAESFANAGCFDETFENAGADVEFSCRLARRGYMGMITPYAKCIAAQQTPPTERDAQRLKDALRPLKERDPSLSPRWREVWEGR